MPAGGASKPICMRSFEKLNLARITTQNAWAIATSKINVLKNGPIYYLIGYR